MTVTLVVTRPSLYNTSLLTTWSCATRTPWRVVYVTVPPSKSTVISTHAPTSPPTRVYIYGNVTLSDQEQTSFHGARHHSWTCSARADISPPTNR